VVTRDKIVELTMSIDQAFTYILSGGAVTPDALKAGAGDGSISLEQDAPQLAAEPSGSVTPP
jgi:uncharacterized membrane protein